MGHKPWRKIHFHEKVGGVKGGMHLREVWYYKIWHHRVIIKSPKGEIFKPNMGDSVIRPSDIKEWIERKLGLYFPKQVPEPIYFDIEDIDFDKLYRRLLCLGDKEVHFGAFVQVLERLQVCTEYRLVSPIINTLVDLGMVIINPQWTGGQDTYFLEVSPWSEVMT